MAEVLIDQQTLLAHSFTYPYTPVGMIDTHTHFDAPIFAQNRALQTQLAQQVGVRHMLLVGYLAKFFKRIWHTQQQINKQFNQRLINLDKQASIKAHMALGLHPFYIQQQTLADLDYLYECLQQWQTVAKPSKNTKKCKSNNPIVALGEIGLDTFTAQMKQPQVYAKQRQFFTTQLDMAVKFNLPVLLHIRKAHAQVLQTLKQHSYDAHKLGGIAHSFSGGEQEAKAFVKLGFKLGVTGQITNPNAKKLRRAIKAAVEEYGLNALVIETDCPDMSPLLDCLNSPALSVNDLSQFVVKPAINTDHMHNKTSTLINFANLSCGAAQFKSDANLTLSCKSKQTENALKYYLPSNAMANEHEMPTNVPANLIYVLSCLSELFDIPIPKLARQLWQNSCDALKVEWEYPIS